MGLCLQKYELPRSLKSITYINFGQGTGKITEVRVGDKKKSANSA